MNRISEMKTGYVLVLVLHMKLFARTHDRKIEDIRRL